MSPHFFCISFIMMAEMYPERADWAFDLYRSLANEENQ